MKGLFFTTTPLQVINAIEAKEYFKVQKSSLILAYDFSNTMVGEQIHSVISLGEWDEIIKIDTSSKSRFGHYVKTVKKLKKENFDYLFVGYLYLIYAQVLLSNISVNNKVALDDGTATITIQRNPIMKLSLEKKIRLWRYKLMGLKVEYSPLIDSFTAFDFLPKYDKQKFFINIFSYLKKVFTINNIEKSNYVYFIGTAVVGTGILNLEDYILYIKFVEQYYLEKGLKVFYIPHCRESQSTLEKIPFELKRLNKPIELELLFLPKVPRLASFFSSAIFNLDKMFDIPKDIFFLPIDRLNKKKNNVKWVYKDLEQNTKINKILLSDISDNKT